MTKTMKSVRVEDGRYVWDDEASSSAMSRTMATHVPHYHEFQPETQTYVVYHYETAMEGE